jgi:hypothetical protein
MKITEETMSTLFRFSSHSPESGSLLAFFLVALLGVTASAQTGNGSSVGVSTSGISASTTVGGVNAMLLRVGRSGGFFAEGSSEGSSVSWSLPGNASDGNYRYEVSATAGSTSYRATGRFSVSGGQIFEQKLRKGDYSPSFWHAAANVLNYLGETVLDMLVPVAQAQGDALVSSAFPTVEFDDTNDVGTNWEILAAAFGFVIVDDFGGTLPLEIDQTPLSELSFLSDPNGDVSFANDAVFVDRDAIRLGVGTITPTSAFHVMKADNTARILVEETAPNVTQQLFTLQNNGDVGFGMVNTNTAQEWRFRAAGDGFRHRRPGDDRARHRRSHHGPGRGGEF